MAPPSHQTPPFRDPRRRPTARRRFETHGTVPPPTIVSRPTAPSHRPAFHDPWHRHPTKHHHFMTHGTAVFATQASHHHSAPPRPAPPRPTTSRPTPTPPCPARVSTTWPRHTTAICEDGGGTPGPGRENRFSRPEQNTTQGRWLPNSDESLFATSFIFPQSPPPFHYPRLVQPMSMRYRREHM